MHRYTWVIRRGFFYHIKCVCHFKWQIICHLQMGKIFAICKIIEYWISIWAIKTKNGACLMTYELENYKSCIRNSWRTLNNVFALNKVSFLIIWALMFYLMVGFYSAKWQNFCHLQYEMAIRLPFQVMRSIEMKYQQLNPQLVWWNYSNFVKNCHTE